jgi:hypothetical protein
MRMGVACIVSMVAISVAVTVPASADTVRLAVGQRLQRFSDLTPGAHRYMRYLVNKDGSRQLVDIWDRRVSFGLKPNGSGPGMRITQRWDRADKSSVLIQDSWFDPGTFRPLTHIRDMEKNGRKTVWGFEFTDSAIVGMQSLAANERADFSMPQGEGHYNFEYDMELLQTLPLAAGRTFDIPFYDAGIDKKPDRYKFVVAGSTRLIGPEGKPIDCWLVTADYNTGKVQSRFWFAKKGQLMLREEEQMDDGRILLKVLLPPEPMDEATPAA